MTLTKGDRGSATVRTLRHAALLTGGAMIVCTAATAVARAQTQEINDLKGQVFDARMAQQSFAGLKHCSELNGTSFYFQLRNRILNLEEYFRSLEGLVKAGGARLDSRGCQGALGRSEKAGARRQAQVRTGPEPSQARKTPAGAAGGCRRREEGVTRLPFRRTRAQSPDSRPAARSCAGCLDLHFDRHFARPT